MEEIKNVLVLLYIQCMDLFSERFYVTGFQENTFFSNSSIIRCDENTTITIVDLLVEQHTTSCSETKHCNLTEAEMNYIKRHCNKERTCTLSKLIPNSCLFKYYGRVSISYSCTGYSNSSCTFENGDLSGNCGWYELGSARYKWKLRKGKTPSDYTGPDTDHTTASANGVYAYTESLRDSQYNDESFLLSGLIVPSTNQCLSFWYHMYGEHINTLTLLQMNSEHTIERWSKSNNQGNKWYFQSLALENIGPYQIIFKAIRGDGSKSDIAVNDIFIKNTVCNKVSRLDCNFENDSCEWKSEPNSAYSWTIFSGNTPTSLTGPDVDHTSGSTGGHYIYLQGTEIQEGVTSNLTSNTIETVDGVCLTFWYHMYGVGMGTLNVYTELKNITKKHWSQSGNQGNIWRFVNLDLYNSEPYRIIFEGVRGNSFKSDIALDDIFLLQHKCSVSDTRDTRDQATVGMPMYTIIGISALVVVLIAALVFTIVICNKRKMNRHSQPSTSSTAIERNRSSDNTTVIYNEIMDVRLPEIHQTRQENSTTHRERQVTTAATEQVGNNGNKYESLSANRTSIEHIYESESIPTNQYESLTPHQASDRHTYETTKQASPQDIETSIKQEDTVCNKYESLSTNRNSAEHHYE